MEKKKNAMLIFDIIKERNAYTQCKCDAFFSIFFVVCLSFLYGTFSPNFVVDFSFVICCCWWWWWCWLSFTFLFFLFCLFIYLFLVHFNQCNVHAATPISSDYWCNKNAHISVHVYVLETIVVVEMWMQNVSAIKTKCFLLQACRYTKQPSSLRQLNSIFFYRRKNNIITIELII